MFKCFYHNYGLDESIAGPDYLELDRLAASKFVRLVLVHHKDFFGLENHEGKVIQFIVCEDDYIDIDVPIKISGEMHFFERRTGLKEVESIIFNLPNTFENLVGELKLEDIGTYKAPFAVLTPRDAQKTRAGL